MKLAHKRIKDSYVDDSKGMSALLLGDVQQVCTTAFLEGAIEALKLAHDPKVNKILLEQYEIQLKHLQESPDSYYNMHKNHQVKI